MCRPLIIFVPSLSALFGFLSPFPQTSTSLDHRSFAFSVWKDSSVSKQYCKLTLDYNEPRPKWKKKKKRKGQAKRPNCDKLTYWVEVWNFYSVVCLIVSWQFSTLVLLTNLFYLMLCVCFACTTCMHRTLCQVSRTCTNSWGAYLAYQSRHWPSGSPCIPQSLPVTAVTGDSCPKLLQARS